MAKYKNLVVMAVVVTVAIGMYFWWHHQTLYPSTDDAYLQSNIISVTPQINGLVSEVSVIEHQYVKAGDVLFELNTDTWSQSLQAASAQLALALKNADVSANNIDAANAQLAIANTELTNIQNQFNRIERLFDAGAASIAEMDNIRSQRDESIESKKSAQINVANAIKQAGSSVQDNPEVKQAMANFSLAQINLSHTKVTAPVSGWIANIALRPGQFVTAGQALFSLVEDGEWWVDGNFKETDLERIRPGQKVDISIDMYPGFSLSGAVQSIGAGSGSVFSLLPAENATGNWVKVTQRFPVRVNLSSAPKDKALQLRVGASSTLVVDTSSLATP